MAADVDANHDQDTNGCWFGQVRSIFFELDCQDDSHNDLSNEHPCGGNHKEDTTSNSVDKHDGWDGCQNIDDVDDDRVQQSSQGS